MLNLLDEASDSKFVTRNCNILNVNQTQILGNKVADGKNGILKNETLCH